MTNDKKLKSFLQKNLEQSHQAPANEWNTITKKIKQIESTNWLAFSLPLGAFAAAVFAFVIWTTQMETKGFNEEELGQFLINSDEYFQEDTETEDYFSLIDLG